MNPLIKHVISLAVAKFHPHIFMHTSSAMSCICALRLRGRFRFVFLSVFSSPKTHHLKFLEAIWKCYETPNPLQAFGIFAVIFFWHKNNKKKNKKMPGYLPERDIKVPPTLLVNHHDLFILTCCYQKSYLILRKGRFCGKGAGVLGTKTEEHYCIIVEIGCFCLVSA